MNKSNPYQALQNLNTDRNPKNWGNATRGRAPHKPFLLLSIIDGVEQGWITTPRIELTQDLVETFFSYWQAIMGSNRKTTIALPYFHMKSEPFWELVYRDGKKPYNNSPSLGGLQDRVAFARLDEQLFEWMQNPDKRRELRQILATTYFSTDKARQVLSIATRNKLVYDYSRQIEQLAAEPFVAYHTGEPKRRYTLQNTRMRKDGFSRTVRRNYDYSCAICRHRVITQTDEKLVEGAHIIPLSDSNNDDPRNGLSLCPTHHWMFDNFMLSIRPDYSIWLSKWLKRPEVEVGDLWELKDERILLPGDERFYPAEEALYNHNDRFMRYHDEHK